MSTAYSDLRMKTITTLRKNTQTPPVNSPATMPPAVLDSLAMEGWRTARFSALMLCAAEYYRKAGLENHFSILACKIENLNTNRDDDERDVEKSNDKIEIKTPAKKGEVCANSSSMTP